MSPSSLIFVAVIAIWATYLVVHVAHRREYLATARSVDRFSSQMRVLQRRAVTYTPPATSARVSSSSLTRPRPLVASGAVFAADHAATVAASASTGDRVAVQAGSMPAAADASARTAPSDALAPPRPRPSRASRVGGLLLVLSLLTAAVTGVLAAATTLVPWFVPVAALAVAGLLLVGLRRAAVARRRAARRVAAAERRRREREAVEARREALEARPAAPSLPVAQEYVAPRADPVVAAPAAEAPETPAAAAVVAAKVLKTSDVPFDRLYGDAGWAPTPVPPPTYTLKARAERPMPPPLDVPVPIEVDTDEIAWDEERRQPRVVAG
ncbi:hypothetical protein [Agilicoccus flavus]|uniref:hypothetical protein n=1 Tax=Agilicoccus flavus TaxID=2775968 RepID=UPI001CF6FF73|nr:hypothetical protein [Agilicoccus flavus]